MSAQPWLAAAAAASSPTSSSPSPPSPSLTATLPHSAKRKYVVSDSLLSSDDSDDGGAAGDNSNDDANSITSGVSAASSTGLPFLAVMAKLRASYHAPSSPPIQAAPIAATITPAIVAYGVPHFASTPLQTRRLLTETQRTLLRQQMNEHIILCAQILNAANTPNVELEGAAIAKESVTRLLIDLGRMQEGRRDDLMQNAMLQHWYQQHQQTHFQQQQHVPMHHDALPYPASSPTAARSGSPYSPTSITAAAPAIPAMAYSHAANAVVAHSATPFATSSVSPKHVSPILATVAAAVAVKPTPAFDVAVAQAHPHQQYQQHTLPSYHNPHTQHYNAATPAVAATAVAGHVIATAQNVTPATLISSMRPGVMAATTVYSAQPARTVMSPQYASANNNQPSPRQYGYPHTLAATVAVASSPLSPTPLMAALNIQHDAAINAHTLTAATATPPNPFSSFSSTQSPSSFPNSLAQLPSSLSWSNNPASSPSHHSQTSSMSKVPSFPNLSKLSVNTPPPILSPLSEASSAGGSSLKQSSSCESLVSLASAATQAQPMTTAESGNRSVPNHFTSPLTALAAIATDAHDNHVHSMPNQPSQLRSLPPPQLHSHYEFSPVNAAHQHAPYALVGLGGHSISQPHGHPHKKSRQTASHISPRSHSSPSQAASYTAASPSPPAHAASPFKALFAHSPVPAATAQPQSALSAAMAHQRRYSPNSSMALTPTLNITTHMELDDMSDAGDDSVADGDSESDREAANVLADVATRKYR